MKNILPISMFILGLISIPMAIIMIVEGEQRTLSVVLLSLILPGFITSIRHLEGKF